MADDRGEQLARLIEENPDDVEAYRVFGDWLEEQGDPRSQLVRMQMTRSRLTDRAKLEHLENRLADYFEQHRAAFLGPLANVLPKPSASKQVRDNAAKLEWRNGFVYKVHCYRMPRITIDQFLDRLLAHPSGRFVVDLDTGWVEDPAAVCAVLAARAPRSLRRLKLSPPERGVGDVWPRLALLEQLVMHAADDFGAIDLPSLKMAQLDVTSPRTLRQLADAHWPKLENLHLRIWPENALAGEIAPVFARDDLPALRAIELGFDTHVAAVLRALRDSPMGAQLTDITLRRRDKEIDDVLAGMTAVVHPPR